MIISYSCKEDKILHPVVVNYNRIVTPTYQDITGNYSSSRYDELVTVTQEGGFGISLKSEAVYK